MPERVHRTLYRPKRVRGRQAVARPKTEEVRDQVLKADPEEEERRRGRRKQRPLQFRARKDKNAKRTERCQKTLARAEAQRAGGRGRGGSQNHDVDWPIILEHLHIA